MSKENYFLDNPEINSYMKEKLPILVNESDRGAVLLGMSQVDNELQKLLKNIAPTDMTNKEKNWIEKATLASKLNIAYTCRLLPRNIFESINKLRKIRNAVAHNVETFNLKNYDILLNEIFELLGEGANTFIHNTSLTYMIENSISQIMSIKHPENQDKCIIEDRTSALNYIAEHKEVQDKIDEPMLKMKLAIGVLLISGIIIYERGKSLKVLLDDKVISSIKV
ncbi:MAG: hypothetical protein U9N04_02505 [Patescibacteria group bacterium]|nr:hypothetical protein [Patescibacteria group bacterium]